jgi:hypothetical protein
MVSDLAAGQSVGWRGSRGERHLFDDDTKVYPIKLVHKLSLIGLYHVKREGALFKSLGIKILKWQV